MNCHKNKIFIIYTDTGMIKILSSCNLIPCTLHTHAQGGDYVNGAGVHLYVYMYNMYVTPKKV